MVPLGAIHRAMTRPTRCRARLRDVTHTDSRRLSSRAPAAYSTGPARLGAAYLVRHGEDAIAARPRPGRVPGAGRGLEPSGSSPRLDQPPPPRPLHRPGPAPPLPALPAHATGPRAGPRPGGLADPASTPCTPSPASVRPALDIEACDRGDRGRAVRPWTRPVTHTDESYAFRVSIGGRPGPRLLRRLRRAPSDLRPCSGRATSCCARSRSGPGPCRPALRTSTVRRSAALAPRTGAGAGPAHPPPDGANRGRDDRLGAERRSAARSRPSGPGDPGRRWGPTRSPLDVTPMSAPPEAPDVMTPHPRPRSATRSSAPGDRAIAAGACRRSPTTRPPAPSRSSGRRSPSTATSPRNLAMKLARPYRDGAARRSRRRSPDARRAAADDADSTPIAAAEVAPPGFLNLRLADRDARGGRRGDPRRAGGLGPRRSRRAARGQRRVRVGQPDRPADDRQRARRVRRRPALPRPRGRRAAGHARVLLQRLRAARSRTSARRSLAIRRGEPVPEDGYHGDYVARPRARRCPDDVWAAATAPDADTAGDRRALGGRAGPRGDRGQPRRALGVHFDVWTSEASLHDEGWVDRAVERLRERGHVYEQDGAIWFRSTAFGDDKDRVIIRSNGEPTYFAADIGYVTEKFSRGFDHLIYIWGADHHGTVARAPERGRRRWATTRTRSRCCSTRWVRFVRDGVEVSMSKRAGEFITLDELLAEVGVDAARWFFASRGADDGHRLRHRARASKQSSENPVYYVQYAHARIASILRKAAEAGLAPAADVDGRAGRRARGARWPGSLARCPRSSRTRPRPRRRRASRPTRPSWRRRSTPSTATRGSSTPTSPTRSAARLALVERRADHARQRARPAGDLRARVDVGRGATWLRQPARPSAPATGAERRVVVGDRRPSGSVPPSPGRTCAGPPARRRAAVGGRLELGRVGVACPTPSRSTIAHAAVRARRRTAGGRRPSRRRRSCAVAGVDAGLARARSPSWNSPNVSSSGTRPARRRARRRGRRERRRRPAPRWPRTSRGGGSARSRRAGRRRPRRRPPSRPTAGPLARSEAAGRVRERAGSRAGSPASARGRLRRSGRGRRPTTLERARPGSGCRSPRAS